MSARRFFCLCTLLLLVFPGRGFAQSGRDYIYIVGSSTVYPFATVVAERFGRNSEFRTPKVEATGSGGGLKLFCDGIGIDYPDVTNASRPIKPSEMQGGCFTISSLGNIGGRGFTPIVNAPEVGILGVSRAEMRPVWDGAEFQPRKLLPLSLSYDHRVINGGDAGRFCVQLVSLLADIRRLVL